MLLLLLTLAVLAAFAWRAFKSPAEPWPLAITGALVVLAALVWPSAPGLAPGRRLWFGALFDLPHASGSYLAAVGALAIGVATIAAWRLWSWRGMAAWYRDIFAATAILTPLAVLAIAYLRVAQFEADWWFAGAGVALAGALYLVADRFDNVGAETKTEHTRAAVNAFAAGCMLAALLAFAMALKGGWLTLMLAVAATTTALFAVIDRIAALRWLVPALGLFIVARLAWDPNVQGPGVGPLPLLNWQIVGYGLIGVAFWGAAAILVREKRDAAVRICEAIGMAGLALAVTFLARTLMTGSDVFGRGMNAGTIILVALLASAAAAAIRYRNLIPGRPVVAESLGLVGAAAALSWMFAMLGV